MDSRPAFVLVILMTFASFLVMLILNSMASNPAKSRGIFKHGIGNVSARYEIQLTPAGWTFAIWGIIYLFHGNWILYAVLSLCRRIKGAPAYLSPCILTLPIFLITLLNHASNIVWLFLWDRENILPAFVCLSLTAMSCFLALFVGYGRLDSVKEELEEEGRHVEIVFLRIFFFNGLGMYGAWTALATVLNLGSGLAYVLNPPVDQDTTAFICLGLIGALYLVFVITDLTILERFSRFTVSPYGLFLWALAGILSKNWDSEQTSSIVVAVMAGVGSLGLVLKLVVSFWRQKQQPQAYRKLKVWATMGNEVYPGLSVK